MPASDALTFEDVTNVWREEKKSKVLTEIRKDFFAKLKEVVQDLKVQHEREVAADAYSPKVRLLSQQINKLTEKAQQIFEFRTEKILLMALRSSTSARPDLTRMTEEERSLFDAVLSHTKGSRASLLDGAKPVAVEFEKLKMPECAPEPGKSEAPSAPSKIEQVVEVQTTLKAAEKKPKVEVTVEPPAPRPPEAAKVEAGKETRPAELSAQAQACIIVRVLEDVPPFAGPKCTYKLLREDVVTLPATIGKALVAKGKAVEIKPYRFE
jgi:DNA replication initiation complex subunit (GINS family)